MLGLITGLLSDAIAPLMASVADFGARLFRKVALFLVAAVCMVVVLIALTIAFDLWIATHAGPIVAALGVAGVYLLVAILAVAGALWEPKQAIVEEQAGEAKAASQAAGASHPETAARVDQFTQPLLDLLQRFGLQREQLAVFAGASIAKRLGPLPLVGCAILIGFLAGRMWKSWRQLLETGLAASPLIAEILGQMAPAPQTPPEPPPAA